MLVPRPGRLSLAQDSPGHARRRYATRGPRRDCSCAVNGPPPRTSSWA